MATHIEKCEGCDGVGSIDVCAESRCSAQHYCGDADYTGAWLDKWGVYRRPCSHCDGQGFVFVSGSSTSEIAGGVL